jgi:hypothetical protein
MRVMTSRSFGILALAGLLLAASLGAHAGAPVHARAGLDLAWAAARAWADDARLVYLENDEDVDGGGAAARWGYLFVSPASGRARAWSVRDGRIAAAENVAMALDAPPLPDGWVDSDVALAAASHEAERVFRGGPQGTLASMMLVRGAFDEADPDRASWALVWRAPGEPALWVVVDATDGTVRRTWRG